MNAVLVINRHSCLDRCLVPELWLSRCPDSGAQGCSEGDLLGLSSAALFVQRASKAAPGLDARLFVGPVIAAALQGASAKMSRTLFLALVPVSASAAEQTTHTKQPLKRALFPEHQQQTDVDGDLHLYETAATWTQQAFSQIGRHVSASNASQLASLVRSLPLVQAIRSFQAPPDPAGSHILPPLSHSTVLLAYLMKALPAPASQQGASVTSPAIPHQADVDSHPVSAGLADGSRPDTTRAAQQQLRSTAAGQALEASLEEAYKRCRKHLRQLEACQLTALLRFWLLQGPAPVPGMDSSRPKLHSALRSRMLQDGVAAIMRLVDKAPGSPQLPSEVSSWPNSSLTEAWTHRKLVVAPGMQSIRPSRYLRPNVGMSVFFALQPNWSASCKPTS